MENVVVQNLILLLTLGIVIFGLSVLKRRLLLLARELSRKAPPVCCPRVEPEMELC